MILEQRTAFGSVQNIGGKRMDRPTWHPVYGWATKEEVEELKNLPRNPIGDLKKDQIYKNIAARKQRKKEPKVKTNYMFGGDTDGKMGKD